MVGAVEVLARLLHPERVPWGIEAAVEHGNLPAGGVWRLVGCTSGSSSTVTGSGSISAGLSPATGGCRAGGGGEKITVAAAGGRGELVFERLWR